jgi:hypothetical protein
MDKEKKAVNPNHVTRVMQVKLQQHLTGSYARLLVG